jgi:hypothetical protein
MSPLRLLPAALALLATPALAHGQQSTSRAQVESVQRPFSTLDSFFGRRAQLPSVADTAASRVASSCPMPVAQPDTTRLERMPRARLDSLRMAPMPVAHGCVAKTK